MTAGSPRPRRHSVAARAPSRTAKIVVTGNEVGLSREQLDALPEAGREQLFAAARRKFASLGAHYVIDSTADQIPVIDAISQRIANGERP